MFPNKYFSFFLTYQYFKDTASGIKFFFLLKPGSYEALKYKFGGKYIFVQTLVYGYEKKTFLLTRKKETSFKIII